MENYTRQQLAAQLDAQLIDPILEIRLYDANGNLIVDVTGMASRMNGMMNNHMMNRMMGTPSKEIDSAEIMDSGVLLGRLDVVRYHSIGNSLQTRMFTFALITILKTHLEGFEDGILEMNRDEIKTCEAQIDSITAIISNMSAMIDAEKNLDAVEIEDIEINQLLKLIVGALKIQFGKKQIDLTLHSHGKITVRSDRNKLTQCIYNILTNAYKFTNPKGKVSIFYEMKDDVLKITIADTGSGIDTDQIKRLFDAYYRGSNAVDIPGEGIGLYVVKENLSKINGQIRVESKIGRGSKFIITIPRQIRG